jgi:phosphatidylglycerophosphate synthase
MTATGETASGVTSSDGRRAGRELVLEVVFRPLSKPLVSVLARTGVAPTVVVVANAAVGLFAAAVLARGHLVEAALLVQLKTLLDNVDGQLARETGRVTLVGRYLDTVADLVVNIAIFAALGHVTGEPLLAAGAFVALVVILAVDFNATELYREARGAPTAQPLSSGSRSERALDAVYRVVFGPLDRFVRSLATRRRASYDDLAVTVLANLGLSTQLAVLGACVLLGAPTMYLWLVLACLVALVPLQLRAERLTRGRPRRRREA